MSVFWGAGGVHGTQRGSDTGQQGVIMQLCTFVKSHIYHSFSAAKKQRFPLSLLLLWTAVASK